MRLENVRMPTTREEAEANREAVAQRIVAEGPDRFDMSTWIDKTACGTVACIAGWAAVEAGLGRTHQEWNDNGYKNSDSVARWLGLGLDGKLLFYADIRTPEDAALALKSEPYDKGLLSGLESLRGFESGPSSGRRVRGRHV